MQSFLQQVAASLLAKFGSNLSQLTVVFPGKRASLFLNQALAEASPTPVWAPRYQTISELFEQASPFVQCDPIEAVCRLYQSYAHHVEEPQSLDQFYPWGEVLLADFDDLDKHLVDAHRLFANIRDLRQLDDNSYITPEQEQALRTFFSNFSIEGNTELKERFLRLWSKMGLIYDDFRESLRAEGMLYEGALQRDVVERLKEQPPQRLYAFVGFNVLNGVEQALFDLLKAQGQALFYWDYDRFYVGTPANPANHEAGYFLRRNLQRYGNELNPENFDNLRRPKDITFIVASSENAQARYVPQWLNHHLTECENRTAVVLCNEQLLQPVLHSLPAAPNPKAVNVTMGFPLSGTPVFCFVNALLTLQTDGYDAVRHRFRLSSLRAVASHPFAQMISEEVWKRPVEGGVGLMDYLLEVIHQLAQAMEVQSSDLEVSSADPSSMAPAAPKAQSSKLKVPSSKFQVQSSTEALFRTFTTLSRLRDLMTGTAPLLDVSEVTLRRLLRNILQTQTIPFHGEPAIGLQVMGVLETRALDFDHLLMLSVGEGFLPRATGETSFIPYNLREAFGLTTLRHRMAVYAYYFYRLVQRTESATFIFNESNVGTRQNEMSRFLRQLLAETDFPVTALRLTAESVPAQVQPPVKEKTPEVLSSLRSRFLAEGSLLSPSAMNTYTSCPLKFYYRYVCGMRIDPDPQDGLDAILFGQVFHRAAELLYRQLTVAGAVIRRQDIEPFLEKDGIGLEPFVRQAFRDEFFHEQPEDYSGILLIAVRVLQTYLVQLLRHDLRLTPFRVVGLEVPRTFALDMGSFRVQTGGIIDRLDEVTDPNVEGGHTLRVVDYKTGGLPGTVTGLDRLFTETGQKEERYFQTILYATIVAAQEQRSVTPCLFYVHKSGAADYSPHLTLARQPLRDVRVVSDDFMERLRTLVTEIFDPDVPFRPTPKADTCRYCDFRKLCGKMTT